MNGSVKSPSSRLNNVRWMILLLAILGSIAVLSACGGDGEDDTVATDTGTTQSSESENGSKSSDVAAEAEEVVAPFIGQPSPFPVTEKLKEVPKGALIVYPDCGTPVCALMWEFLQPAAEAIGAKLQRIKAGPDTKSVTTGYDTVVAENPEAVFAPASNIELWQRQLKQLQENDTAIVTTGIVNVKDYGIEAEISGNAQNERSAELMANYVLAEMDPSNIAIYIVPELPFTIELEELMTAEFEEKCPDCELRTVKIPSATLGNTAPNTIVSDLQANPDTTVALFAINEAAGGLPPALRQAGIEVESIGYAPTPENLQSIKAGDQTAALGFDIGLSVWAGVDMLARQMVGQPLSGETAEGIAGVNQFLRMEDITFDPSKGWSPYPDYPERFEELWGVGG